MSGGTVKGNYARAYCGGIYGEEFHISGNALIEENEAGIDYGGLTREDLTTVFFPEESFYLDENGDPVFYMQPGDIFEVIPEGMDLLIFPIPLEDILDEL